MKYIIVDLEATCWEERSSTKKNEIIEIGALKLDEDGETESEFAEFVKPLLNPVLSPFCKQLTSITQTQVDEADRFPQVLERFRKWIGSDYVLCSWGFYDRSQFNSDCDLHRLDTRWLKRHISLKHQYTDIRGLDRHTGMSSALRLEKLKLEGTHHRGIDDARNIAKIFRQHLDAWEMPDAH
jgi:3'-5' exoribonuclease 1